MVISDKLVYPAFIQQDDEGIFCVYFPTLFPESGWDFPLSRGETKREAITNAKMDLAYSLAGILYDNEELPEPITIQRNHLSQGMELIEVETSFDPYAEEIEEHLKGRHWHICYYVEKNDDFIEAIGYKNDQGTWDIFFEYCSKDEIEIFDSFYKKNPDYPYLFTVKLRTEAEEKFNQFVEDVILKRRGYKGYKD
ncbi:type II toxin-antitoxin system HicB family antitoxin [Bacillus sp. DTU_2020_1000418_1_SI_GHA_SEK_038]|uniref:type II toxin-antitoxin system HicB family antitoxin n=1 Tax=Bacillus sp. DTU_2020_1000418_1_SI_GHA_SEK_038 TaxID=3077585 RepID=UPI0028E5FAAE|nr:type II toxin-antitoxin system HicB family antitoxin [Bacillus sp. DTU_2020_1000418_1_SI_GHA_SEK_038]WNS75695.1 type II toxin-antitoxin system HicB family antitoxin [Bacillus sp. DTU_2020_1000418_1_SI_GHA_SEK_038]